jgi:hypothetical protein
MQWSQWPTGRKVLTILLLLIVAGGSAGGATYWWITRPLATPKTVESGLTVMDSRRFKEEPSNQQLEYLRKVNDLFKSLPQEEQDRIEQAARMDFKLDSRLRAMRSRLQNAETLDKALRLARASAEERLRLLDEEIDRQDRARASWRPPTTRPSGVRPATSQPTMAQMKARARAWEETRIQTGNPQEMPLLQEYFRAVWNRRQEREAGSTGQ